MKQFEYNPEELTQEQLECIDAAQQVYDSKMKRLIADEEYRMKNYYDCVDDYSWGGLCSQANNIARSHAKVELEEAIEMIVRGGFIIRIKKQNVLKDKGSGAVVAKGLHEGKYGCYFCIENRDDMTYKNVGFAKQLSTYEKKGYIPYVQTVKEKLVPKGWWRGSCDRRYDVVETVLVEEKVSTERVY